MCYRLSPADDEIHLVALAGGAAQASSPIGNGGVGTISRDLIGYIGLGPVPTALAPYEKPHLRRGRLPQCYRCGLAMTGDNKAIVAELLREVIERDRFPLSRPTPTTKAIE